jgi:uncharacterized protein YdhG (YjbR/CyaY superfamily)
MPAKSPDAYLATLSRDRRATLEKLRNAIRVAAPAAQEGMSYGLPAFIQGKPIAGYAAAAKFCSYYPMSGRVIEMLKPELAGYETSKGAIHFPIGKPLSLRLVRKLVKARLAEIEGVVERHIDHAETNRASTHRTVRGRRQPDARVVALLRDLRHPLKKEIEAVRRIILGVSPGINEGVKWNAPSFRTEKEYFATFNMRAKDSVQIILHLGAKVRPGLKPFKVADPKGLLKWLGKDRALATLGAGRDIPANRAAFEAIVRAWLKAL